MAVGKVRIYFIAKKGSLDTKVRSPAGALKSKADGRSGERATNNEEAIRG